MPQRKTAYSKPEVLTLDSTEILALVGPAQGYGSLGGESDPFESVVGAGSGRYSDVNRR
jgi:hypothetical protein